MPKPRSDGTPAAKPRKQKLSDIFLKKLQPQKDRTFTVWDSHQRGLAVTVQPTGHMAWKCIYPFHGRPRWYHIGAVDAIGLGDARKLAADVMYEVAKGNDPAANRKAERSKGTFEELAAQYLEEHAKKKNRSWKQADALVQRHLIPKWGKLRVADISRSDVKAMMARIKARVVANQTLAAASAIFAWAIKEEIVKINPCSLVDRNPTKERERVLSDSEIANFWAGFDEAGLVASTALKTILLTGQRPGEIRHMRREQIVDNWWVMPGEPVPALGWPGTKNGESHRVWLSASVQALLTSMNETEFVFGGPRGGPLGKHQLGAAMRATCTKLKVERATPHDLRRTFSTRLRALGFGEDDQNRITNHKEGGIAGVYNRHGYSDENKHIMETVATHIMGLVEGRPPTSNVVAGKFGR